MDCRNRRLGSARRWRSHASSPRIRPAASPDKSRSPRPYPSGTRIALGFIIADARRPTRYRRPVPILSGRGKGSGSGFRRWLDRISLMHLPAAALEADLRADREQACPRRPEQPSRGIGLDPVSARPRGARAAAALPSVAGRPADFICRAKKAASCPAFRSSARRSRYRRLPHGLVVSPPRPAIHAGR